MCNKLNFDGCLVVDSRGSRGSSGDLALLWKTRDNVTIHNYLRWHISAYVVTGTEQPWLFTGFYGNPKTSKRHLSWEFLKSLKPVNKTPWLCCGDFNEIFYQAEKMEGAPRPYKQMESFRNTLEWCSFNSILTKGPMFTWANNRMKPFFTKERLDRALANPNWMESFNESCCHAEELCNWFKELDAKVNKRAPKEIRQKLKRLGELQEADRGDQLETVRKLQSEIDQNLAEEDLKWKQRAKQHWLQKGDRNTTFYHLHASYRRKINKISQIMDHRNPMISDKDRIRAVFTSYFLELFTTSTPSGIEACIRDMPKRVTTTMNALLLQEFTEDEVKCVVFQMKGMGSLGPDGFPALFYQSNWDITRKEVSNYVLNILNNAGSLDGVNDTSISLIPKVENPTKVSDYRHISLCNVIYKVVAKVLSNRLKLILPDIISVNQSAFVPGRAITDTSWWHTRPSIPCPQECKASKLTWL
ncbi:hypothetical protein CIPAW_01G083900 [Carya illinoinensis]|uniref:Reverse transcriptase domain-containing protein n=1 Tax=Carya illinoinensis TaxID=32201 RepID=A0A8T1RLL3_CARIL|nr:hypothetical protein CIPAW_01G083900 [Carya illinoinensis]